jgi:methylglutaconyl-CoA hydratase
MPDELVHLTLDGPVATVTLDSPHNRNALSRQLFADLERQVSAAIAQPGSRVVVITGAGTVFCSGADLKEQREANERGEQTGPGALVPILEAIMDAPKPVIARVNVAPAVISVVCIPRLGLVKSRELMLTGETFGAEDACRWGLLNAVAPADALDAGVRRYVDAFLSAAPGAMAETKAILRRVPGMSRDEAFPYVSELSARLFAGVEALEGFTAFAEKRPPRWAAGG